MKHFYLTCLCCLLPLITQAQNQIFGKYQSSREVRYVCITQATLEAMSAEQTVNIGGYSLTPVLPQINNIVIIRSDRKNGCRQMDYDLSQLRSDKAYRELLFLQKNQQSSQAKLFRDGGKQPNEYVLYQRTENETIFIILTGSFSAEQIQKIL